VKPKQLNYHLQIITITSLLIISLISTWMIADDYQAVVIFPALIILFAYLLFSVLLIRRIKSGLFGEIGFIFLGFTLAYTIIPVLNFLVLDFNFPLNFDGLNFSILNPQPFEIAAHLWRHSLFFITVMIGYIITRGYDKYEYKPNKFASCDERVVGIVLLSVYTCMLVIFSLSAPVETYYDHYTRFDSLPLGIKYLAYICLIIKAGGYYVALTLMFSDYKKYKYIIFIFILTISAYELIYSLGSRIETLSILLASVCLYHFNVRKIRLKDGFIYLGVLLSLFTLVEIYRGADFDLENALIDYSDKGLSFAVEFSAVYYTSFHLYWERMQGLIPSVDWRMLINDFFTAVPFYGHTEFNSQYWYANLFFPDAIVPPQTMGPIADSAIWGGEIDLAIRGFLTGCGYGWITRWTYKSQNNLFPRVAYVYLFATSVMALKYSLIYQISQMLRTLLPIILFTYFVTKLRSRP
jgi:hypothetical protein